jgi:hypothetical protein
VKRKVIAAVFILLTVIGAVAEEQSRSGNATRTCKANSKLAGQCFQLHGRAFVSNGTPNLRIWDLTPA